MLGELLTGFVDAESVARRSVGVAFTLSAAAVFVLGRTSSSRPPTSCSSFSAAATAQRR
jgi:hypothetical protein